MNNKIWEDQLIFNKLFFEDEGLNIDSLSIEDKIKWTKEFVFHMNHEIHDLVDCLPKWKMHYKNEETEKHLINSNLKEEYVDAFKYFMGLGQLLGITHKDVEDVYAAKTEVVKQKYEQNKKVKDLKDEEVVVFDIDGILNYYPLDILNWINKEYNSSFILIEDAKKQMGIELYEEYKEKYRLSGEKRFQKINKDTVDSINNLSKMGYKIVLYTVRPVNRYKRIYHDTLYWLNSNNVKFDAIFWSDFSKEDFHKLGLKIKFVVDDTLSNVRMFAEEGLKVYLLDAYYNKSEKEEKFTRIEKVSDILRSI